jgi:hypothetical protein
MLQFSDPSGFTPRVGDGQIFMIHYNLWFDLRSDSDSTKDLGVIQEFLRELHAGGSIAGFQILENCGAAPKTKMLRYQALIEFSNDTQFSAAFSAQAARGIHTGLHGRVMSMVSEFRAEIFRQIATSGEAVIVPSSKYACEI